MRDVLLNVYANINTYKVSNILLFAIIGIILIIGFVCFRDKFKYKFSSKDLIEEKDIDKLEPVIINNNEMKIFKKLLKIKPDYILPLIFLFPTLFFGFNILIGCFVRKSDILTSLLMSFTFFIISYFSAKGFVNYCIEKTILTKKDTPVYKIEVYKFESYVKFIASSDFFIKHYYYMCVKSKSNIEIKKWYEVSEEIFNEKDFYLYYFEVLNKKHVFLFPKNFIEDKLKK